MARSEESKALRELLRAAVHFEKKTPKLQRIESQRQALREAITQAQLVLSLEKQAPFAPGGSESKDAAVSRKTVRKRWRNTMQKLMIALVVLACFASPVSAGCAWVLWERITVNESSNALLNDVFTGLEECKQIAARGNKAYVQEQKENPTNRIKTYYCLPDTMKPDIILR